MVLQCTRIRLMNVKHFVPSLSCLSPTAGNKIEKSIILTLTDQDFNKKPVVPLYLSYSIGTEGREKSWLAPVAIVARNGISMAEAY